jgi:GMP synthase-like glutamine amidotransferase
MGRLPGAVLCVQHQDDCPPGHVGQRLADLGADLVVVDARQGRLPDPREFDLVVSLGSDDSAHDDSVPYLRQEREVLETAVRCEIPVLGICFGAQLLSVVLGGSVAPLPDGPEIGWLPVRTAEPALVNAGPWLIWHLDAMTVPPGAVSLASTDRATQAFAAGRAVGLQFHPEVTIAAAQVWAAHYRDHLVGLGIDPEALLDEVRAREPESRRRAHELTDRVLERLGFSVLDAGTCHPF